MKRIFMMLAAMMAFAVASCQPAFAQSNVRIIGTSFDGNDRVVATSANGGLQSVDSDEAALRAQNAYVLGTGMQSVTASNSMYVVIKNTSSTKKLILSRRDFAATNNPDGEYVAYLNPTLVPSTAGLALNRWVGSSNTTFATVRYQIGTGLTMGGIQGTSGPITEPLDFVVIVPPLQSLGFIIQGAGGSLQNAARVMARFVAYEDNAP